MNRFIDIIIKNYRWIIIITTVLAISAGCVFAQKMFTKQLFVNNIDIFFEKDDPDLVLYKRFVKTFGSEEIIAIVISDMDIFTTENIEIIRKISRMAKSTLGVANVFSLTEHITYMADEEDIAFQKLVPNGALNQEKLLEIKNTILGDEILSGWLVSKNGRDTIIVMELMPFKDNIKKQKLILEIREKAQKIAGKNRKLIFTGPPYVECEISRLSQRDFLLFTPIVFFIIFILVVFLLRNGVLSILCQMDLFITLILSLGLFTLCGESLNIVTTSIGPILLVIAVADSLHVLSHFRDRYNPLKDDHLEVVSSVTKRL
ncbi:MAG: MMPL family transporter [Spirochaetota bacterium]|nr:MMPL family transporter [Spirochaetota bacterium]